MYMAPREGENNICVGENESYVSVTVKGTATHSLDCQTVPHGHSTLTPTLVMHGTYIGE